MDPATPVNVAKGAAITCKFVLKFAVTSHELLILPHRTAVVAGTFTALHSLYRGSRHPTQLALSAGANGGIAGAVFFGVREVVVTPLLHLGFQNAGHPQDTSGVVGMPQQPSWSQLRMHKLLDSATSGALTGAIINKWRNGRVLAGARTAGLLCALLQLGHNEIGVARIKYVTRKIQEPPAPKPLPAPLERPDEVRLSVFDRLLSIVGFRKLSEEEYLKTLKKQRDEALARIAVLERERQEREHAADDSAGPKPA
ncbi:hypothetical protein C2E23DRAFT_720985 [Lenzites betulinus]|nr:hypothetical protein C2E23DRAFT_720985 [Lenzites betulinus]